LKFSADTTQSTIGNLKSAMTYDAIIIGAGHNGLVTACYLAKAGLKTLILERREVVGGGAITEEFHTGFRCSTFDHTAGPLAEAVFSDLNLAQHGLEFITPVARVLSLTNDGRSLCIYNDTSKTVDEIKKFSTKDANSYPEFLNSFSRIGNVLAPILSMTPPSIDHPTPNDAWQFGKIGLSFRKLGKTDEYRMLRWGPMAVADLVAEWFDTEVLRATAAARGISGTFAGPWSAGTSLGLLMQAALDSNPIAPALFVRNGMGGLTKALSAAAIAAGAEIRTQAEVARIENNSGKAKVVLTNGDEFAARAVVSNADPRTTFLNLVDPIDLEPGFLLKMRNYRAFGSSAKINLALADLPAFNGVDDPGTKLTGRIHIGPEIDYLEKAFDASKYGGFSQQPYMDVTIPSLTDSSLAPAGKHVMSIHVQFAPHKLRQGDWESRAQEFADTVINHLDTFAPGLKDLIIEGQVITPLELDRTYGLSNGNIHHGEQTLDQFFTFRPLIGWAQYRTPIERLYLCGAGTHPGGGITGLPGANAAREILKDFKTKKL
jgi:phytoene dehydrogenase-like protein